MRIYAVADIHGKPDKLALTEEMVEEHHPDVLVLAGDITSFRDPMSVISRLNDLPVPVLGVRGNMDRRIVNRLLEENSNTISLHAKEHVFKGVSFVGISGTVTLPFRSKVAMRERRMLELIGPLVSRNSVMVVHTPPWGILDEAFNKFHVGSKLLANFIVRHQPRLLLCGHVHDRTGFEYAGQTVVVNCNIAAEGRGTVIDIENDQRPIIQML